ncbi:class I SAM-dependent methyltransferase [Shouchella shacheensis]|uniref:class I SAM-dependent methyltransferase n=1 Tax=Shouchella shacheensis TaxID=1649580 RepID=UPI0007402A8F|nr:class I SAM-dependent methyltransferase [Shouchella shacheensis]
MSEHYYSRTPTSTHEERTWAYELRGETLTFTTDRGVFSRGEVDYGSRFLIESFLYPDVHGGILDVGCGYGPIGLALAKQDEGRQVHMVDVNERAVELCERNRKQNQVKNAKVYVSDGLEGVEKHDFAAIVTNPPIRAGKKVVHRLLEQAYDHLTTNGQVWVVIQKKQGAPSAKEKLRQCFGNVETVAKDKGYYLLCAEKV